MDVPEKPPIRLVNTRTHTRQIQHRALAAVHRSRPTTPRLHLDNAQRTFLALRQPLDRFGRLPRLTVEWM